MCLLDALAARADSIAYVLTGFATLALVVYTLKLAAIAGDQTAQLKATYELAAVVERPHMFVFGPFRLEKSPDVVSGFTPFVAYTIANYGKRTGILESIEGGLAVGGGTPPDHLDDASTAWRVQAPVYTEGVERKFKATLPDGADHDEGSNDEIMYRPGSLDQHLFLRIRIKYRGPSMDQYETNACWILSDLNNRFVVFGGEQHNNAK